MHVIICGGGVIGAACAYELSRRDVTVTLVERWRIAGCASGKSGGFLARDWCDGTPVAPLAQRSFDLHATWAEDLGNPYGYRRLDTYGAAIIARAASTVPTDAPDSGLLSAPAHEPEPILLDLNTASQSHRQMNSMNPHHYLPSTMKHKRVK